MSNTAGHNLPVQPDQATQDKYDRVLRLYQELRDELSDMNMEVKILRKEIQQDVDQQKMKQVLEHIVNIEE